MFKKTLLSILMYTVHSTGVGSSDLCLLCFFLFAFLQCSVLSLVCKYVSGGAHSLYVWLPKSSESFSGVVLEICHADGKKEVSQDRSFG